jgi:phosphoglycolate phosphatase
LPAPTILFDLDGTITEPAEGIIKSIRYALERMGKPAAASEDLRWCIGPPLRGTFPKLLETSDAVKIEETIGFYRERYRATGIFEAQLYPGIAQVLAHLAGKYRMFVATAKPHEYAGKVLEHFSVHRHFARVYGPELDGTFDNKTELVAHMIAREKFSPESIIMIGDRWSDMEAAVKNGGRAIGALWGYGSEAELRQAGAHAMSASVSDLAGVVDAMVNAD